MEIDLADDKPYAIEYLLMYLYTYQTPVFIRPSRALRVFVVADKYDVQPLKKICSEWLIKVLLSKPISQHVNQDKVGREKLAFGSRLWSMQQTGLESVRTLYIKMVIRNRSLLFERKEMKDLLTSAPEFSFQLVQEMGRGLMQQLSIDLTGDEDVWVG
jgi:hypothetical protein